MEGENKNKNTFFYDTKDFEVYCICPILFNYNDLNYFFVGGFDSKRKIGYIKLVPLFNYLRHLQLNSIIYFIKIILDL